MKKAILIISIFTSIISFGQEDYTLSRAGHFVNGVYIYVMCTPVSNYDFVGNIKTFDVFTGNRKSLEKILKKAKKKYPAFDGIIFRHGSETAELIKFKERTEVLSGFRINEKVSFVYLGRKSSGKILLLDDAKKKAVIEYTDEEGEKQHIKVPIKKLSHQ